LRTGENVENVATNVPYDDPGTPSPKPITSNELNRMLIIEDNTKKYSGVLEFPNPLNIEVMML